MLTTQITKLFPFHSSSNYAMPSKDKIYMENMHDNISWAL